jgi:hypothetical protein
LVEDAAERAAERMKAQRDLELKVRRAGAKRVSGTSKEWFGAASESQTPSVLFVPRVWRVFSDGRVLETRTREAHPVAEETATAIQGPVFLWPLSHELSWGISEFLRNPYASVCRPHGNAKS